MGALNATFAALVVVEEIGNLSEINNDKIENNQEARYSRDTRIWSSIYGIYIKSFKLSLARY